MHHAHGCTLHWPRIWVSFDACDLNELSQDRGRPGCGHMQLADGLRLKTLLRRDDASNTFSQVTI